LLKKNGAKSEDTKVPETLPRYCRNNPFCLEMHTPERVYVFACPNFTDAWLWHSSIQTFIRSLDHNRVIKKMKEDIWKTERELALKD
jgi:hypothetical protein